MKIITPIRLLTSALVISFLPVAAAAQCRDEAQTDIDWVLTGTPKYPVTLEIRESVGATTLGLTGRVCNDENDEPLAGLWVQLVRYEGTLPADYKFPSPSIEHFETGHLTVVQEFEFITSESGSFSLKNLPIGKYALLPAWEKERDVERVKFDVRISYGYSVQAQYVRP